MMKPLVAAVAMVLIFVGCSAHDRPSSGSNTAKPNVSSTQRSSSPSAALKTIAKTSAEFVFPDSFGSCSKESTLREEGSLRDQSYVCTDNPQPHFHVYVRKTDFESWRLNQETITITKPNYLCGTVVNITSCGAPITDGVISISSTNTLQPEGVAALLERFLSAVQ